MRPTPAGSDAVLYQAGSTDPTVTALLPQVSGMGQRACRQRGRMSPFS